MGGQEGTHADFLVGKTPVQQALKGDSRSYSALSIMMSMGVAVVCVISTQWVSTKANAFVLLLVFLADLMRLTYNTMWVGVRCHTKFDVSICMT